jgi:peptidoglycan lytic transglycosylase G
MTIRRGGGPREERGTEATQRPMARPIDGGGAARPPGGQPGRAGTVTAYEMARRRPGSGGIGGLLRVAVFLAIAAAVVLVLLGTVLRPLTRSLVVGFADANPRALALPFVADFVREDLGNVLTDPASSDSTEVDFTVTPGETASGIAGRLVDEGVLRDKRAFLLIAIEKDLTGTIDAGTFLLRRNLTPEQLVATLLEAKDPSITIQFRTGLRLEQMTAYLEAHPPEIATLQLQAADFLALVRKPPASLLADYPWLQLPEGATLEGYLAAGAYRILPDTSAEELVRKMLDRFYEDVGPARIQAAQDKGVSFHEIVTLASLVERETADDSERAPVAGVFRNRMSGRNETAGFLGADPTIFYINDSLQLAKLPLAKWPTYVFWAPPAGDLPAKLPAALAAYNTYTAKGLPPGPICTPSVASIDAALDPDTKGDYLYFFATKDGRTVFAKTYAEHLANIKKYGGG